MTAKPTPTWSDTCAATPEPPPDDDTDGPWCRTPGLLPEQRERVADVDVEGDLL